MAEAAFEEVGPVRVERSGREPRGSRENLRDQHIASLLSDTDVLTSSDEKHFDEMRRADEAWASGDRDVVPATPTSAPASPPAQEMVPRSELEAERQQRQVIEERAGQLLQRFQAGEARRAEIAQYHPQPAQLPDAASDPVAHLIRRVELSEQREALRMQNEQAAAQHQQVTQAYNGLVSQSQRLEKEFEAEHPDYPDAVKHWVASRGRELEMAGYGPQERARLIQEEGLGAAARAIQLGQNPSSWIYRGAEEHGYRPGRGTPRQAMERRAAGMQHANSLSNMGGRSPRPLSADRLLESSDADFAALIDTPEGRALLGA